MAIPVYITSHSVPGVGPEERTEWTSVCHSKQPFITIGHDKLRSTSRWQFVERKRPFYVRVHTPRQFDIDTSWYETLDKARAGAWRKAVEWGEYFAERDRKPA